MNDLNYHHLRYFREVAHEGHLTRAADKLNLSQSALSAQIRTLEARLGHPLFDRVGRRLVLTEAGRIALDHADRIFGTGAELLATLQHSATARPPLRVGALSTLSRNFQLQVLRPVLARGDVDLRLSSGGTAMLMQGLRDMALDVVLTTDAPGSAFGDGLVMHRLAEQPVGLFGTPEHLRADTLADLLAQTPVILPTESAIRAGFDALTDRLGIVPHIVASVDDMAMIRLLAREGAGLAVAPSVVFADEIAAGRIRGTPFDLGIVEQFLAVTLRRTFPHPLLETLIAGAATAR